MSKQQEIIAKINGLTPDNSPELSTRKITITLPVYLIDYVKKLKTAKGYKSDSFTIRAILENYFNGLLDE